MKVRLLLLQAAPLLTIPIKVCPFAAYVGREMREADCSSKKYTKRAKDYSVTLVVGAISLPPDWP